MFLEWQSLFRCIHLWKRKCKDFHHIEWGFGVLHDHAIFEMFYIYVHICFVVLGGQGLQRVQRAMKTHKKKDCPQRKVVCKLCKKHCSAAEIPLHERALSSDMLETTRLMPMFPVSCRSVIFDPLGLFLSKNFDFIPL